MPLDTTTLQTAIKTAFETAKNTPPPADPSQAGAVQEQILTKLSQDLSAAIHAYLLTADVTGVAVTVVNTSNVTIGTGTQTGAGKLQ
jgi:hypothetical protein